MDNLDSRMLSALELLHYSARFAGELFAFCFRSAADCDEMLVDLRTLHAAQIKQVLFCPVDESLTKKLNLWNLSGEKFEQLTAGVEDLDNPAFIGRVQRLLSAGKLPIVQLATTIQTRKKMLHCAVALGAVKLFFPGAKPLMLSEKRVSCPSPKQLQSAIAEPELTNLEPGELQFYHDQLQQYRVDLVTLEATRGSIFQEVFTHAGAGTLYTQEFPNILRQAEERDVMDMLAMMQPYVSNGLLKPLSQDQLLESISDFTVYTVNRQIVALASLTCWDDCWELGKLCTLPRYQARGRARSLVREFQQRAIENGVRGLFSLSVSKEVGDFFQSLDFTPIEREELPRSWQAAYDFNRPSKAFWFQP